MCGRITCYLAPEDLSCSCKYKDASGKEHEVAWIAKKFHSLRYVPSYNMGPRDTLACIVAGSRFDDSSTRIFCPMMWGMIPSWHKGEYRKHNASTHNARLENLSTSKLYGKALNQGKRCAVVVNGFYEWKTEGSSTGKRPYYVYKSGSLDVTPCRTVLYLAGLFDQWTSREGRVIYSCSVLTTAANDVLSWLHGRAPVILQTEEILDEWLDYKNCGADKILAKLRSTNLSKDALQWHRVAPTVNNVRNKEKSCVEPTSPGKEKKRGFGNGSMSAWLSRGTVKPDKRKSNDDGDDENSESEKSKRLKTEMGGA